MYVCMYVCICMYACMYVCTYIYVCINACTNCTYINQLRVTLIFISYIMYVCMYNSVFKNPVDIYVELYVCITRSPYVVLAPGIMYVV